MFISANVGVPFVLPINLVFWGFVVAYVIHILEESVLPEVFVEKVKRLYWPEYSWKKFFGFNTILLAVNITAIIVFENAGSSWIVFPLCLAFERIFNGLYHLTETIVTQRYSSGLLSSVLTWILGYLIIKYSIFNHQITSQQIGVSLVIGFVIFGIMIIPLVSGAFRSISHHPNPK